MEVGTCSFDEGEDEAEDAPSDEVDKQNIKSLLAAKEDELPKSLGKILAEALEVTPRQSKDTGVSVAIPAPIYVEPLSEHAMLEARQASLALRTRLQGILQTKILIRAASGRRGCLDTRKLHRLAVSDPRVFRIKAERMELIPPYTSCLIVPGPWSAGFGWRAAPGLCRSFCSWRLRTRMLQ